MNELKIAHAGLTDIGNVRTANEDSLGSLTGPYGPIFTVCDGMGGHVGGATASTIAVKTILEFITTSTVENPSVTINNALISANQKILETVVSNPELRGMGTTAVVLVVQPEGMYIGHVGDSRIYIYSDNQLHRLTKDDSFVQTLVDSGAITDEEAEQHPRKNELMKALGVADNVQPTILSKPIKPKKDDTLLLCSDGLCGLVPDAKMQHILSSCPDLRMACEQLIAAAKDAGGDDNITVQLVKVTESPYKHSDFISYSRKLSDTAFIPASKFSPTQFPPDASKEVKKNKKITSPLIILILAIFLLVGAAYFTKIWPFNGFSFTAGKDSTIIIPETVRENGLFPSDRIKNDYLIHLVDEKETDLESILKARRQLVPGPYQEYNLDSAYSPNNVPVNQDNFKKFEQIKWKKKQIPFQNTTIVVESDKEKQLQEEPKHPETAEVNHKKGDKKDSLPRNTKDTTGNRNSTPKTTESTPELEKQLKQAETNLATAKANLAEAERKFKAASDSVDVNVRSGNLKLRKWEAAQSKARREQTVAQDKKKKCEAVRDNILTKIDALKKTSTKPD
jgi:serine/threonine protein phosphatase PrpC